MGRSTSRATRRTPGSTSGASRSIFEEGIRLPVINKKIVELNSPQRGDVVVFRYPVNPTQDFIKRVVGLPGDVVSFQNQKLSVNGQEMALTAKSRGYRFLCITDHSSGHGFGNAVSDDEGYLSLVDRLKAAERHELL